MSKVMFQIMCMEDLCGEPMRYDAQEFESSGFMEWTCWNCEKQLTTSNLLATIVRREDQ